MVNWAEQKFVSSDDTYEYVPKNTMNRISIFAFIGLMGNIQGIVYPHTPQEFTRRAIDLFIAQAKSDQSGALNIELARSKQLTCADDGAYIPSCVIDDGADNLYTKGAGTVFLVSGTGGRYLYDLNLADPETNYFAKLMAGNKELSPSKGFVKITVTASELRSTFIGNGTGTFTDSFAIRK